jgi:hypothetical protein
MTKFRTILVKTIFASLLGVLSLMWGCSSGSNEISSSDYLSIDDDYFEYQGLNLQKYELPFEIMLPDETANIGASTIPLVLHKGGDFYWDIEVGNNFSLHIEDYGDFNDLIKSKKEKLKNQKIFKVDFLLDQEDVMVYKLTLVVKGSKNASPKVGVEHSSYHVYGQKEFDGIIYELRSQDEGGSKEIIELMVKSIKSFKPISNKM